MKDRLYLFHGRGDHENHVVRVVQHQGLRGWSLVVFRCVECALQFEGYWNQVKRIKARSRHLADPLDRKFCDPTARDRQLADLLEATFGKSWVGAGKSQDSGALYSLGKRILREMLAGKITDRMRTVLREAYKESCAYCGVKVRPRGSLEESVDGPVAREVVDHIHPLSQWGLSEMGNVLLCCERCNSARSDMEFEVWVAAIPDSKAAKERMRSAKRHIRAQGYSTEYDREWLSKLPEEVRALLVGYEHRLKALSGEFLDFARRLRRRLVSGDGNPVQAASAAIATCEKPSEPATAIGWSQTEPPMD